MQKKSWSERVVIAVILAAVMVTVSIVILLWLRLAINTMSI
ncbi:hypothetical protein [Klebsiella sp. BIGb0407]|nr:hypothetical protein [Klebsiella sp. BIGb0407]MCS3429943.1 putative membrane protein [Klebsiella sp. BIGb0407]